MYLASIPTYEPDEEETKEKSTYSDDLIGGVQALGLDKFT
jgi:hypothetical protein